MPEDDDVADESDVAEIDVMSRPRTQETYDDDNEDEATFDTTGEELEEEYVCVLGNTIAYFLNVVEQAVDEQDMQTLDALLPSNAHERRTLADIIFAKLDGGQVTSTATIEKVQQGISKFAHR